MKAIKKSPQFFSLLIVALVLSFAGCRTYETATSRQPHCLWEAPCQALPGNRLVHGISSDCDKVLVMEGPLDLATLVDISLENNPKTRASWYRAKIAAAELGQARSPYYPEVTLGALLNREKNKNILIEETVYRTTYGPSIDISYLLFDFGRRSATAASVRQSLYAANFNFNQQYQDTILAVQTAYYRLHGAQERVQASKATVKDAEIAAISAKEWLKQGTGNKQDMLRAESIYEDAKADLQANYAQIEIERANLAEALGLQVNTELNIIAPEVDWGELEEDVNAVVAMAMKSRPSLLAAYADVCAKQYAIQAAKSDFLPEIFADVSDSVVYTHGRSFNPREQLKGELVLKWDIFEGFNKKYRLLEARAEKKAAEETLKSEQLRIISDIWEFYYTFSAALLEVDARRASVLAAEEAYRGIELGYRFGVTTLVEQLQALSDLSTSRQAVVDAEVLLSISLVNLAHATGKIPLMDRVIYNATQVTKESNT